jgi:hypothetical protein
MPRDCTPRIVSVLSTLAQLRNPSTIIKLNVQTYRALKRKIQEIHVKEPMLTETNAFGTYLDRSRK